MSSAAQNRSGVLNPTPAKKNNNKKKRNRPAVIKPTTNMKGISAAEEKSMQLFDPAEDEKIMTDLENQLNAADADRAAIKKTYLSGNAALKERLLDDASAPQPKSKLTVVTEKVDDVGAELAKNIKKNMEEDPIAKLDQESAELEGFIHKFDRPKPVARVSCCSKFASSVTAFFSSKKSASKSEPSTESYQALPQSPKP